MKFNAELKSLTSAYKHNPEAIAAIKDVVSIFERHLFKIVSVTKPKTSTTGAKHMNEAQLDAAIAEVFSHNEDNTEIHQDMIAIMKSVAESVILRSSSLVDTLPHLQKKYDGQPTVAQDLRTIATLTLDLFQIHAPYVVDLLRGKVSA